MIFIIIERASSKSKKKKSKLKKRSLSKDG